MTDDLTGLVGERLAAVHERIERAGRDADTITIVAVTKGHDAEACRAALDNGLVDLGESYAQELEAKAAVVEGPRWHFIGQLQRRKVRTVAHHVALWQSADRRELVDVIAQQAPGAHVLVQVNLSEQDQKAGCSWAEAPALVTRAHAAGLVVDGLMGVGPFGEPEDARPGFRRLAALTRDLGLTTISMGMSADVDVAVQEGATMLRLGTTLFGRRSPRPGTAAAPAAGP